MTDLQKKYKLIERCVDLIPKYIKDNVPESGSIGTYPLSFDWPGTANKGYFIIENDYSGGMTGRRIRTAMCRKGSDRLVSHYYFKGSNYELCKLIIACDIKELIEEFDGLSESVDDMDD